MVNRPRNKGTAAETAVVGFLQQNGFPWAERRSLKGIKDRGDITGTPGLVWEVKHADAGIRMGEWISQTYIERANAGADHGVLIMKPKGMGATRVSHWFAAMVAWDFDALVVKLPDPLWVLSADEGFNQKNLRVDLLQQNLLLDGKFSILNRRPPGMADTPSYWYRIMHLSNVVTLLRAAGYGSPLPTQE